MKPRQIMGSLFTDLGDGERIEPAREREMASSLDRFEKLPRVLLSEDAWFRRSPQVKRRQVGQLKVEDIQGFVNETTLNEFVGDDSTKCVEFERPSPPEVLQPPGLLSGTLRILAHPNRELRISGDRQAASGTTTVDMGKEIKWLGSPEDEPRAGQ